MPCVVRTLDNTVQFLLQAELDVNSNRRKIIFSSFVEFFLKCICVGTTEGGHENFVVNNELVKLWKEMVTLYFKLRSHHSSDAAQTKHRSSQKLQ